MHITVASDEMTVHVTVIYIAYSNDCVWIAFWHASTGQSATCLYDVLYVCI